MDHEHLTLDFGIPLTARESTIADLAAAGFTNKEIAGRLFLSPRTVSGHLYFIFPKLGITRRSALRDALLSRESRSHAVS